MKLRGSIIIATLSTILFVLTGLSSDYSTRWHTNLRKPSWLNFERTIPWIWAFIYVCSTISAILTWNRAKAPRTRFGILTLLALGGAFNLLYSITYTRKRDIFGAFLDCVAIVATIIEVTLWQWPISKMAALLNLPYIFWGSIATYITWFIYKANRAEQS